MTAREELSFLLESAFSSGADTDFSDMSSSEIVDLAYSGNWRRLAEVLEGACDLRLECPRVAVNLLLEESGGDLTDYKSARAPMQSDGWVAVGADLLGLGWCEFCQGWTPLSDDEEDMSACPKCDDGVNYSGERSLHQMAGHSLLDNLSQTCYQLGAQARAQLRRCAISAAPSAPRPLPENRAINEFKSAGLKSDALPSEPGWYWVHIKSDGRSRVKSGGRSRIVLVQSNFRSDSLGFFDDDESRPLFIDIHSRCIVRWGPRISEWECENSEEWVTCEGSAPITSK